MLDQFLISELFAFLLIFSRLGSALMLLPGFGEAYVTPRTRLFLALLFSLVLVPVVNNLPPVPVTVVGLVTLILSEILVGLFMGALARFLIAAMHMAGTIISYQSSLASALIPSFTNFQGQDTSIGNFMTVTAVVLIFATDLHHLMLQGLADSYTLFIPGAFPMAADFADHAARMLSDAFLMAMKLAAPSIVVGIILYLGSGIIARLMPNIQVFFIMLPPNIYISFCILLVTFSAIMLWYLDYLRANLSGFLYP